MELFILIKMDVTLNFVQELVCHKNSNKQTNKPINSKVSISTSLNITNCT